MATQPVERATRPWWALLVGLTALASAAWVLGSAPDVVSDGGADQATTSPMVQVAPGGAVALASLPADHQTIYLTVADDPDTFGQIACYCGCVSFLDHRHLLDCFVRPDGGWERHATGCAVCLAEAREVIEMRDRKLPLDEIIRQIDRRYGDIPDPSAA